MKRLHLLSAVFIVAMSTAIFISAADIYKWVDADGNTHYGDIPPIDASSELVRVGPSSNGGRSIRSENRTKSGQVEPR
jgi:hypothetical protein